MESIDNRLENLRREIEIYGKTGHNTVFLTNVLVSFDTRNFDIPSEANHMAAMIDFEWFLECSANGRVTAHPNPKKSFWIQKFGENAEPYGYRWNIPKLCEKLERVETERQAILYNGCGQDNPPCISNYHFQRTEPGRLDVAVLMRSSDVVNVLAQDVTMSWLLLKHIAKKLDVRTGKMNFYLSNAHVYLEDANWPVEPDYFSD